jgi:hypothetical protein
VSYLSVILFRRCNDSVEARDTVRVEVEAGAATPSRCVQKLEVDAIGHGHIDVPKSPYADYFQYTLAVNDLALLL